MKRCPNCGQRFTDDNSFCLDDGTVLIEDSGFAQQGFSTGTSGDIPTQVLSQPGVRTGASKAATSSGMFVILGALATALIGAIIFIVYLSNWKDITNGLKQNPGNSAVNGTAPSQTPVVLSTNTGPPTNVGSSAVPKVPVDREQIQRDLTNTINGWKEAGERRNLDAYMSFYADTVDYYKKRGSSKSFVRNDKGRYFDNFQTASVTIGNLNIVPSADGDTAEALFDKEWMYNGNTQFSGKVRDQFRFRKVGGRWLIIGERDLKVYYINK